ncbi:MAG: hypothetical protein NVSMB39_3290 [Candidatus Saccharimonadales bacterium]
MTTTNKILISAGLIVLISLTQLALAQQLVLETTSETFSARSPILIALSFAQVMLGLWTLANISQKVNAGEEKPEKSPRKRTKHAK